MNQPPTNSDHPTPRSAWWVGLVHPLRWGFWLVSMPLLGLTALGAFFFSPWLGEWQQSWKIGAHTELRLGRSLSATTPEVRAWIHLGPLRLARGICARNRRMVPGWAYYHDDRAQVHCWQYGWGHGPTNSTWAAQGLYLCYEAGP